MANSIREALEAVALATVTDGEAAATEHFPRTRHETRAAAVSLLSRGYGLSDAAHALRLTRAGVLDLLAEAVPGAKRHG